MRKLFNKLKRATGGVAVMEFALSLPLLMLMLSGVVDISGKILAKQRMTIVAEYAAHAAAATPEYTGRVRKSIERALKKSFSSEGYSNVIIDVYSLKNDNGTIKEIFHDTFGDYALDKITFPSDFLTKAGIYNEEACIYVVLRYKHQSYFSYNGSDPTTIQQSVTLQPKTVRVVEYSQAEDWGNEYVY